MGHPCTHSIVFRDKRTTLHSLYPIIAFIRKTVLPNHIPPPRFCHLFPHPQWPGGETFSLHVSKLFVNLGLFLPVVGVKGLNYQHFISVVRCSSQTSDAPCTAAVDRKSSLAPAPPQAFVVVIVLWRLRWQIVVSVAAGRSLLGYFSEKSFT